MIDRPRALLSSESSAAMVPGAATGYTSYNAMLADLPPTCFRIRADVEPGYLKRTRAASREMRTKTAMVGQRRLPRHSCGLAAVAGA